jgi:ribose transport system permease protein
LKAFPVTRGRELSIHRLDSTVRLGIVVLIIGLVLSLLTRRFLSTENLLNVLTNASLVAIVGLGMTIAIGSGNFDLSVGATAAFASIISLSLVDHVAVPLAIVAGLVAGAVIGFVNGLIVSQLRVAAFIATLGTLTIIRGLALMYTHGRDIYLSGSSGYKVLSGGALLGIPMPIVLALVVAVILWVVLEYTRFGRQVLAVGSNAAAAHRAGVRVNIVVIAVFAIVGATASLTGMIQSAEVLTANGRLDAGLELSAIAVAVIGGTPLSGGRARIVGTVLASVLIAVINNGLNLLNVPIFYQDVTVGLLLLFVLALQVNRGQVLGRRRGSES